MLEPLKTHTIDSQHWQQQLKVTLNVALDGCIVPTQSGAARVDYSHLVVLNNFLDESTRQQLLDYITEPGWTSSSNTKHAQPPSSKWEQATCDAADAASKPKARTWGLTAAVLQRFAAEDVPAKLEVQSRLCALYPDAVIAHMPSEHIQAGLVQQQATQQQQQQQQQQQSTPQQQLGQQQESEQQQQQQRTEHSQQQHLPHQQQQPQQQQEHGPQDQQQQEHASQHNGSSVAADCSCFLANAAVHGDCYSWHVDADPSTFPSPSPWTDTFGSYCNREPGKPLLFSLLLYLDGDWPLENDAETLFLDSMSDSGVFVRPKRYRAVLMDQDVVHRLSAPSPAAGRPRFSLVWKLVMLPKRPGGSCSLARPEWGPPTYFGSAAHVRAAAAAAAAGSRLRPAAGAAGPVAAAATAAAGPVADGPELSAKGQVAVGRKRPADDAEDQRE